MIEIDKLHKFINVPVDPEIDLFSLFPGDTDIIRHKLINRSEINKNFFDFFDKLGIEFPWLEAFYTPPGGKLWIHSDSYDFSNWSKINWVYCAEPGTEMRWWKVKDEDFLIHSVTDFGNEYYKAEEKDCKLIYSKQIDQPSIVQVGVLHSTYNPTSSGRWALSLSAAEKNTRRVLSFEETCEILKDYTI